MTGISRNTHYIYGPAIDDRVAMVSAAGVKSWYHANHQLSTVMLTNASGNVTGSYKYLPFGESPALATGNPYGYTGRRYDPETGLYYYRARYYSTTLGRFLQTDPVGYEDDLNLYGYVKNDPLNATDPSGEVVNFIVGGGLGFLTYAATQVILGEKITLKGSAISIAAGAAGVGLVKQAGVLANAALNGVRATSGVGAGYTAAGVAYAGTVTAGGAAIGAGAQIADNAGSILGGENVGLTDGVGQAAAWGAATAQREGPAFSDSFSVVDK